MHAFSALPLHIFISALLLCVRQNFVFLCIFLFGCVLRYALVLVVRGWYAATSTSVHRGIYVVYAPARWEVVSVAACLTFVVTLPLMILYSTAILLLYLRTFLL